MAQNKIMRFGPVALTTTLTTNILNPTVTSMAGPVGITIAQPYVLIKHLRIVNKTGSAATFSLWIGATGGNAAGTEVIGIAKSVAANDVYDWYAAGPGLRLDSADFLVGGSGTATALTIQGEIEVGISG
jgi:hypothetical protein